MPKIAKRDLGPAAADAEKDHPLAPVGSTLDTERTWHRETCGGCDYEAVLSLPDDAEGAVVWDCPSGHRNAVGADTDARSVTAGDSGRGQNS